jgi:hypothetical protein
MTLTMTLTVTVTLTMTLTMTVTLPMTLTMTVTLTMTLTVTVTLTMTLTMTVTLTVTLTMTLTLTVTLTMTLTVTLTMTLTRHSQPLLSRQSFLLREAFRQFSGINQSTASNNNNRIFCKRLDFDGLSFPSDKLVEAASVGNPCALG